MPRLLYHVKMQFLYFIIALLILLIINAICKNIEEEGWAQEPMIIYWPAAVDSIACYTSTEEDALQSVEDPSFQPKSKSIFFHETSCRGGLDSRQACTVESAARAHPDWDVYLLFNSPVKNIIIKRSCIAKLLEYPNVKLARINASTFSKKTPVHNLVTQKLYESQHPIEHSADIMKMLTLNKWGGVYLDLDQIVISPLDSLPRNWLAKETPTDLATGIVALSTDVVGRNVTSSVLKEISKTYDPKSWTHTGQLAIERVLLRRCNKTKLQYGNCGGVSIFSHELFYPIHYSMAHLYFRGGGVIKTFQAPYTHHLWNLMTKIYDVHPNSPYTELARKHCPKIYHMHGKQFGV